MPGKPGSGGPVPKPTSQRRRRNKTPDGAEVTFAPSGAVGQAPSPDDDWHPRAREWFESLGKSGQASLYEPSDWAMAKVAADMMSKLCEAERPSAQMLASLLQLTTELMCTEGARRRLRLELARGPQVDEDEQASVTALSDYMTRAGG